MPVFSTDLSTRSCDGHAVVALRGELDLTGAAPGSLLPSDEVRAVADGLARRSGVRVRVGEDLTSAVEGADFLYTDVWVSMGEPAAAWGERIKLLLPYQVDAGLIKATGNPEVKFMHCLPALHNTETEVGRQMHDKWGLSALEVTDEVFESPASIVFDQAENRLHTIKAAMVATAGH